jgi:hypothetical protein
MTTLNAYCTLAEFKAYALPGAGTNSADDSVIESILAQASELIENRTGRFFYPAVETRYFSVPDADSVDPRLLKLDGDLLEIISVTNGDGTAIASTEYTLKPRNTSPYYGIRLADSSTFYWSTDSSGDTQDVIAVAGIWGYHNHYDRAWATGSTLAEPLDTSETGFDVTSGSLFAIGQIVRFDNELSYLSGVSSNALTGTRGENGSTAATHDSGETVYYWKFAPIAVDCCLQIAKSAYKRRFGENTGGVATVTAAGVVITPEDIPANVHNTLAGLRRII